MLLLRTEKLPQGPDWLYEIKLDGYRILAINSEGKVRLRSRNDNDFTPRYAQIASALHCLPNETVIDGEVVALDESGRPDFNLLQHSRSAASRIHHLIFDLLVHKGRDLTRLPLIGRRELMRSVLKFRSPLVRIADHVEASATDMLHAVREQHLEGVIGKQRDSLYEPGKRSGAWIKYRASAKRICTGVTASGV